MCVYIYIHIIFEDTYIYICISMQTYMHIYILYLHAVYFYLTKPRVLDDQSRTLRAKWSFKRFTVNCMGAVANT